MECKNVQCFCEQKVAVSSARSDNCMLQYRLNSDCLLEICDYLDVEDLKEVCKLGDYFHDLITSHHIPTKVINISKMDERTRNNRLVLRRSSMETFKMFGEFMRKIAVRGEDFGLF